MNDDDSPWPPGRITLAAALGLAHALAAVGWMAAMAGGFPWLSGASFAHRWLPGAIAVLGSLTVAAVFSRRRDRTLLGAVALMALWTGIGLGARVSFPVSAGLWWLGLTALGPLSFAAFRPVLTSRVAAGVAAAVGVALGLAVVATQRAPEPGTVPAGGALAPPPDGPDDDACWWTGTSTFDLGVELDLNPILVFDSVSPDRFWTALAPDDTWRGHPIECLALRGEGMVTHGWFRTEALSAVRVEPSDDGRQLQIDAVTRLEHPVYSHLNHIFEATLTSQDAPVQLTLGPCVDTPIDPPSPGNPSVFGYVDADRQFVVARASDLEKGPFTELCRAALPNDETIVIGVWVAGENTGEIVLRDFASQADTAASPTAGWGVPRNAIELWAFEEGRLVFISGTLAGTSVGRGWHTVGHAAGTYANRILLRRR